MNNQELATELLKLCGGSSNVELAESCMTRLRVILYNASKADLEAIKKTEGVLGLVGKSNDIQIVIGPGKAARVTKFFNEQLEDKQTSTVSVNVKDAEKKKENAFQGGLKKLAQIFIPLIPGIMAAGLLLGIASILNVLIAQGVIPESKGLKAFILLITLIANGCLSFLCIFVGINSAKVFKCTTILGGLIGGIVLLQGVTEFAQVLNDISIDLFNFKNIIYNTEIPANSLLSTGKGGVIGVVLGVWILSKIEKWLHAHIPETLDLIIVPVISTLVAGILMIFIVMPLAGLLSTGIIAGLNALGNSQFIIVKIIYGFLLGATFLPMVMLGLHQSLVPIYVLQVDTLGYITIIAPQMMAGGANIGAAIIVYFKAKKVGHKSLQKVIAGSLPTAVLGIHEPLIYSMTLPIAILFVPIGIGAGIGGIYCVLTNVCAASFGPATLLGVTTMQPASMLNYLIGLVISCVATMFFTQLIVSKKRIQIHKEGLQEGSGTTDFNEMVKS